MASYAIEITLALVTEVDNEGASWEETRDMLVQECRVHGELTRTAVWAATEAKREDTNG